MGRPRKNGEKEKKTPKAKRMKTVHDPEVITQAIESVKTGRLTQRQAAKTFNIPFSTLNDKIVGKTPIAPKNVSLLLPEEEDKLVKFILDMAKCGFGQTSYDIRRTAQAIINLRKPPDEDNQNINMPSVAWVYRLFERHPQLTLRSTMSLGKERATVTPQAISKWFQAAGIVPFDPNKVLNSEKLAPCAVFRTAQAPSLPEEQAPPAVPSATSLPEEPAPPGLPSAMSLPEKPAPPAIPSAISLPEKSTTSAFPFSSSIAKESLPVATHSGSDVTNMASAFTFVDSITPSTSNSASASNPSSILLTLTVQQLKAIKEFGIFLYDDLLRKQFMRFFSVLAGRETAPSDDSFKIFQERVVKIVNAFTPATSAIPEKTPVKTPLTVDDILKLPKFNSTKKKGKKLTPTIPHCISSEDFRGAMKRKLESKEKEEKEKLAKKTMREENKRKKEEKEMIKRKKELEKLARQQKKADKEKRKQQKRELVKQRKEKAKASRARMESSSSGEDKEMESQMLIDDKIRR